MVSRQRSTSAKNEAMSDSESDLVDCWPDLFDIACKGDLLNVDVEYEVDVPPWRLPAAQEITKKRRYLVVDKAEPPMASNEFLVLLCGETGKIETALKSVFYASNIFLLGWRWNTVGIERR